MSRPRVRRWNWGDPLAPLRRALERGAIIAVPTESSYGLAVDPRSEQGVMRIFRLKGRRGDSPLPVVAADRQQLTALGASFDDPLLDGLATLWPAPLSLLLPLAAHLPAAAGSDHLAARVPAHARLRELLSSLGTALTATSANRSGEAPLTRVDDVMRLLADGSDGVVVDDGALPGGEPSTLVESAGGRIRVLRHGAVPEETLFDCLRGHRDESFSAASVEIPADESR